MHPNNVNEQVPPPIINSLGLKAPTRQEPMSSSWGARRVVHLRSATKDVVVKGWTGEREEAKGKAETDLLAQLATAGYHHAPRPVQLGERYIANHDGRMWTAQEFISGMAPGRDDIHNESLSTRLGAVLGAFHRESTITHHSETSRLHELETVARLAAEMDSAMSTLVIGACQFAIPRLNQVLALRRATVHGDCNFENMIESTAGLVLIDFEFARTDVRLLDLAALAAPLRDSDGTLQLAPATFQRSALRAYAKEVVSFAPLEEREVELLPLVSLMHFLLVVGDQLAARSQQLHLVLPVIGPLLRRANKKLRT